MAELGSFLPIILIFALFYFLLIRPQSKRAKQQRQMQSALAAGDRVMLTSGIHGHLVATEDLETVDVQVAEGVVLTVARAAIASVVRDEEPAVTQPEPLRDEPSAPSESTDDTRREL